MFPDDDANRLAAEGEELVIHRFPTGSLFDHAGEVVSHRGLLQAVWGPDYGNEVEYLRVFINQVRKKIERDPRNPRYLLTEPSIGYRLSRSAGAID